MRNLIILIMQITVRLMIAATAVRKGAKVRSIAEVSAVCITKLFRRLLFFMIGD